MEALGDLGYAAVDGGGVALDADGGVGAGGHLGGGQSVEEEAVPSPAAGGADRGDDAAHPLDVPVAVLDAGHGGDGEQGDR